MQVSNCEHCSHREVNPEAKTDDGEDDTVDEEKTEAIVQEEVEEAVLQDILLRAPTQVSEQATRSEVKDKKSNAEEQAGADLADEATDKEGASSEN